ncbi:SSI family serine proteinase inhibitor [Glycomyces sp. NRRL B-16210]|uniref:SSI family serine proteinase inhibitor n=1 Tax=Glycomyces sp. NRRL B-16210 TaxID=1463821 RepID=UPI000689FDE2|nr:SSI family serine proteinase inhibitor [Glycomyces sp. NRRL B-16210]
MNKLVSTVLGAAGLAALLTAAPAQALTLIEPDPATGPHSELTIRVTSVEGGGESSITLSCPAQWSAHPNAEEACAQLEAAGGHIDAIGGGDGMCTAQYDPVRVVVTGNWHRASHFFIGTYGNRCQAVQATGGALLDF